MCALCWGGGNCQDRASHRYFPEPILRAQFLNLPVSGKALQSPMVTPVPRDAQAFTRPVETFRENTCALACIPFTRITWILTVPLLLGAGGLPGYSPRFAPDKTSLATLTLYIFLSQHQKNPQAYRDDLGSRDLAFLSSFYSRDYLQMKTMDSFSLF